MTTKICKRCGIEKDESEFYKNKQYKDGLDYCCKECMKLYKKQLSEDRVHEKISFKVCKECGEEKDISEFYKDNTRSKDGYNSKCKQCCSENAKKMYRENPEYRMKIKQWNDQNNGKWQKENFEKHREDKMRWFSENPDKTKDAIKKFRVNHPDKVKAWDREKHRRRREAMSKLENTFTKEEWEVCLDYFNHECAYCGNTEKIQRDHFISALKGGPFTKGNVVPACPTCNIRKSDQDFFKWYPKQKFYDKEKENKIVRYLKEMNEDEVMNWECEECEVDITEEEQFDCEYCGGKFCWGCIATHELKCKEEYEASEDIEE